MHLDPSGSLKRAYRNLIEQLGDGRRSETEVRRVFRQLVGDTLFHADREAKNKIISDRLSQGSRSVAAYAVDFRAHACQTDLDQATLCEKFVKGLEPALSRMCRRMHDGAYWSNLDACMAYAVGQAAKGVVMGNGKPANTVAAAFHGKSGKWGKKGDVSHRFNPTARPPPPPPFQANKRRRQDGGNTRDHRGGHKPFRPKVTVCWGCGQQGHKQVDCPNK